MVSRESGRTPRFVFGTMVRFYRERTGMTRPDLARLICKSVSLVQAIELGDRIATRDVTADLETALATDGVLTHLREAMGEGLSYQGFPAWFADWSGQEASADTLRTFELAIVPGLLQTEAYARALVGAKPKLTVDDIDELVRSRLLRQKILVREDPPMLWVVLDEAVLRRPIGGAEVMLEQVNRLIEAAQQPNIVIEVVPASVGAYMGIQGPFIIADFEDSGSIGFQEMVIGAQPIEEPKHVAIMDFIWNTVRMEALRPDASLALLEEVANSWNSET